MIYGTAARCPPKVLYMCNKISVFLFVPAGFVQARGPAYRAACGLHYLTSVKGSLPTAQQISNLQGGPSGIEHLRKGAGSAMNRGRDPPSGGSGVLVPWTLDSRQKNSRANRRGRVPLGAGVRISLPPPFHSFCSPFPFTPAPSTCRLAFVFW